MKAELALAKGILGRSYYLVINDTYYLKINKKKFNDLAKFLNIKVN